MHFIIAACMHTIFKKKIARGESLVVLCSNSGYGQGNLME